MTTFEVVAATSTGPRGRRRLMIEAADAWEAVKIAGRDGGAVHRITRKLDAHGARVYSSHTRSRLPITFRVSEHPTTCGGCIVCIEAGLVRRRAVQQELQEVDRV